jgi:hydrogenase expression/formation protein HypE
MFTCPIPISEYPTVLLAHGGGGRFMHQLLDRMILQEFRNPTLDARHDGALLQPAPGLLAFTTDSFVVNPPFFPGGDIGSLAVFGTVNDLAMCGASPRWLSVAFILEEGLPMQDLWHIVRSMRAAADRCGVLLATGDTKVVDRGKGDRIFITTTGVGEVRTGIRLHPTRIRPGDAVILSGPIALHGVAIMSVREGIAFETSIVSDAAPLHELAGLLLDAVPDTRVLRDPTRGGVASTLNELATAAGVCIQVEETAVPVPPEAAAACEILGLDPLYVANEGKFVAVVPAGAAEQAVRVLHTHPLGLGAAVIGSATTERPGTVLLRNPMGGRRILDMLSGEQLPRIC